VLLTYESAMIRIPTIFVNVGGPGKALDMLWSDYHVRLSWGSWGLEILDKIIKMDFREGSFPEGKLVM